MPELPDIVAYIECLRPRVVGRCIRGVRISSPFVLRSFDPPVEAVIGQTVRAVSRLGKRIVFTLDEDLFIVLHLMIAGRLRWNDGRSAYRPARIDQAVFNFESGRLVLTEASQKKRAALHVERGAAALQKHNPGGLEPLAARADEFAAALRRENHTLKRSLTDPRLFSGIGNAYADEILHAARLSPVRLTGKLTDEEMGRLQVATRELLAHWTRRLVERFGDDFPGPGDITAFRPEFAVHGRFGKPCPVCGAPVQRICYAENETNYCPRCQTEDRILADRSLSRLLKDDWPRSLDELES